MKRIFGFIKKKIKYIFFSLFFFSCIVTYFLTNKEILLSGQHGNKKHVLLEDGARRMG